MYVVVFNIYVLFCIKNRYISVQWSLTKWVVQISFQAVYSRWR